MYRLVIADDEEIIRKGLAELIHWNELGYDLVACLSDGGEVISFMKENNVDVIFTDIHMGTLSGLELAKYVFENRPEIKVVILSGYKEFEYAREAIGYGVENYILKPTRFPEVIDVFREIRRKLDREKEKALEQQKYKELLPMLQEQFVSDLFMGILKNAEDIDKRLTVLNLKSDLKRCPCCAIKLNIVDSERYLTEKWQYGKETFKNAVNNFLRFDYSEICCFHTFNTRSSLNVLVVSLVDIDRYIFEKINTAWISKVKKAFLEEMGLTVEVSEGIYHENIYEMIRSSRNSLINAEKVSQCILPVDTAQLESRYKLILSKVTEKEMVEAERLLKELLNEMLIIPREEFIRLFNHYIQLIEIQLQQLGIKPDAAFFSVTETELKGLDHENIGKLAFELLKVFDRQVSAKDDSPTKMLVTKAKQYIRENFHKDISLEETADHIYLNPAYLSRIFKQHTGESFTDYLTGIRMEEAVILLSQQRFKVKDISEKVGYKNSRYFCKVFKQHTGCSPKEFSYKMLLDDGDKDNG